MAGGDAVRRGPLGSLTGRATQEVHHRAKETRAGCAVALPQHINLETPGMSDGNK
jgi:hypothetical protein